MTDEEFINKEEYARLIGTMTEIWMNNAGKTNEDVLRAILTHDGLSDRQRIYMAFIHGIEVARREAAPE
jgi:hypothetical protein